MTKRQQLLQLVKAGELKIDANNYVHRFVKTRNEWVSDQSWRSDVVKDLAFSLYSANKTKKGE